MAEYIDREATLKVIFDIMSDCKVSHKCRAINRNVKQIPTTDVVEVVRCKECGYCELRYPAKAIGEEAIEGYFCWLNQKYLKPTDFCSYGIKRGEENAKEKE